MIRVSSPVFQAPVPLGGAGAIEVHVVTRAHPRVLLGAHRHADLELIYFESGGGWHGVEANGYPINEGDLYLLPPGQVHDLSLMDAGAHGWAIEFSATALEGSASGESTEVWRANPLLRPFLSSGFGDESCRLQVPVNQRAAWSQRCREMEREYQNTALGRPLALSAQLTLMMIDVARLAQSSPATVQCSEDSVLTKVFTVIEESWSTELHPTDIAKRVRLSPAYLTTLVRRRTGRPLSAWITERKMAEARKLLLSTERSVESIAAAVGYADPAHFSRRFRQLHGAPPGRWRSRAI